MTISKAEVKVLTETLKNKLGIDTVKFNRSEQLWEVSYEECEFDVIDSYKLVVANDGRRSFKAVSTIRIEI